MKSKALFALLLLAILITLVQSNNKPEDDDDSLLPAGMRNNPTYTVFKEAERRQRGEQARQTQEEPQEKKHKMEEPKTPIAYGKFFCEKEPKLNSVRQEVMTTANYKR